MRGLRKTENGLSKEAKVLERKETVGCKGQANFLKEYYSILRAMSVVNYGVFTWEEGRRRLFPASVYAKIVQNVFSVISVGLGLVYTYAMLSSDYVDINKLEIHNLAVLSADMVVVLVHLNQFVVDFSLYKFNAEITQCVNAMLNLEEYGRGEFQAIGNWSRSFELICKAMRFLRNGGILLVFFFFFRETSVEALFCHYGFVGRLIYATVGLLYFVRLMVTINFHMVVNFGHYEFMQFWIRQLINSTRQDQSWENTKRCIDFYQMLVLQQNLQAAAFGEFYLPVGTGVLGVSIFWAIICTEKLKAHLAVRTLFFWCTWMALMSLYLQYSQCTKIHLLSRQFKSSIRSKTNVSMYKVWNVYRRSLRPITVKFGSFGSGSMVAFFKITIEICNYYVLVSSLYAHK
ncbi:unnamed protein product [Allacma fusca]|uniref:Uncharacterized protein n=1 Tax=Allacma fusca TaxID=39272 RepID=A0A8J2NUY1_9HEXA|nr:unnamed protein product [Allacma fusca]